MLLIAAAQVARCCLAVMVVLVFGNVVLRYGFNSGIAVSEELSRWLFVCLTFLGAIVALREHAHLGVDSLVERLPPLGKKICLGGEPAADALSRLACFLQGSWVQTRINLRQHRAGLGGLSVGCPVRGRHRLRRVGLADPAARALPRANRARCATRSW